MVLERLSCDKLFFNLPGNNENLEGLAGLAYNWRLEYGNIIAGVPAAGAYSFALCISSERFNFLSERLLT